MFAHNTARIVSAVLSGVLLVAAFPPFSFSALAFVALVPLLAAIDGVRPAAGFRLGLLAGFVLSFGLLYWVSFVEVRGTVFPLLLTGVVVLCLYLGCWWGLFAWLVSICRKGGSDLGLVLAPPLWTTFEFLRTLTRLGFPWGSLAYTQTDAVPFVQFASFTGIAGVTLWIVIQNVLVYRLLFRDTGARRVWTGCIIAALFLLPCVHGRTVLGRVQPPRERTVILVQANIDPNMKWEEGYRDTSFAAYDALTRDAVRRWQEAGGEEGGEYPPLVIWAETAVPSAVRFDASARYFVTGLARELGVPILTGAPDFQSERGKVSHYNAAFLALPSGEMDGEYRKLHLLPFGEMIPYDEVIPILRRVDLGEGDFSPGDEATVFEEPGGTSFGVLICFESVFPRLVRRFVLSGAEFVVNITNDGWFGRSAGPYQHASMAIFRAIEYRMGLARCANTGVSMIVDPYGRIVSKTRIFERAIVIDEVALRQGMTFYARHGDLLVLAAGAASLLLLLVRVARTRFTRS
ncbi:hypothetical protein AMJ71_02480 [candidate division TA06 bacterium SM1_40]|uniref:Apolipoprotein N-acyltransferase n=1 Tax=candidate division TA06 bacterium SM1_40 TaxID=1703773 RepID=A0A0S8JLN1_UNCT6|nr:MAG: hypothetical protein AMJ71_02480 [candidate division TA06 bacterium SM1_40]